jgi:glycosyltransferase involved in cell wall biosynthesis
MMVLIKSNPERINNFHSVQGLGLLAKSRNIQVKNFLDNTTDDWLFIVDADEYISEDGFEKLVNSADKDVYPFVSGLYFAGNVTEPGKLEPTPLIFVNHGGELGVQPFYDYPKNSLVEIYAAGTGAMMIHRSVLEEVRKGYSKHFGEDWAWFQDGPIGDNKWLSEDLTFCERVQSLKIPMVAHTGAIFAHHKRIWVVESNYDEWLAKQKKDSGYGNTNKKKKKK